MTILRNHHFPTTIQLLRQVKVQWMANHWIKPLGNQIVTVSKYHLTDVHSFKERMLKLNIT